MLGQWYVSLTTVGATMSLIGQLDRTSEKSQWVLFHLKRAGTGWTVFKFGCFGCNQRPGTIGSPWSRGVRDRDAEVDW